MCELKKLVKKKIRKNLRKYEEYNIKEQESTEKMRRELCLGRNIMLIRGRIKQTAGKFYEDLYNKKEENSL